MKRNHLLLFLIILLAAVLRLWQLGAIPEGFHADEACYGYNAYSILQTGRDEYGKFMPLILKSFGDYKGAVYSYLAIPSIKILGLTELAVRLPTALFGVLLVLLTYLLVKKMSKDKKLALLTALLIAISPLSVLLSRVQSDPLVAVFFVILAFYLFLLWIENNSKIYPILILFFWIISFFTNPLAKVFLPVFILLIGAFYFNKLSLKQKRIFTIISLIIVILDSYLLFGQAGTRFTQLNVFNTPNVTLPLQEKIREDGSSPIILTRVFHNKLLDYSAYFLEQYSQYFSFDFLFSTGGLPFRERIPSSGIIYLIETPFILFGIYRIINKKIKWGYFIILWILMVPLTISLASDETPNVHRFFLATMPIEMIAAYGILSFLEIFNQNKRKYLIIVIIITLIFAQNLFFYLHNLFVHQPVHEPWYRGYAYKQLVFTLDKYYPNYKKIVFTKAHASPYIYILFFNKYSPQKYQSIGSPRDLDYSGFDKYYFVPLDCPLSGGRTGEDEVRAETGVLYINKGDCTTPLHNVILLDTINWGDGSPAFKLLEYTLKKSVGFKK